MSVRSPIEQLMDGVSWEATDAVEATDAAENGDLPYATHHGIWHFAGHDIRVYRLNDGRAIIHADDMAKLLGIAT